jgi:VanZ family protein
MNVSTLTAVFSLYIIISSSFMRYILNLIRSFINNNNEMMGNFIWFLFGLIFIFITVIAVMKKRLLSLLLSLAVLSLIVLYASFISIAEERIHLIQFGLLGFSISRDNLENGGFKGYIYAVFWCFIIATADEIFQYFLPSRIGDVRDVLFGFLGGLAGMVLYLSVIKIGKRKGEAVK